MIGLDTNVLVRFITADDKRQAAQAARLIESRCTPENPGFIDRVALCELVWVLSGGHGYAREEIATVIAELLASRDLRIEDSDSVRAALGSYRRGRIEFADALIAQVNLARGCEATATFDRRAAKSAGFILV
jgi:predicted nucleic-acid-binding protein